MHHLFRPPLQAKPRRSRRTKQPEPLTPFLRCLRIGARKATRQSLATCTLNTIQLGRFDPKRNWRASKRERGLPLVGSLAAWPLCFQQMKSRQAPAPAPGHLFASLHEGDPCSFARSTSLQILRGHVSHFRAPVGHDTPSFSLHVPKNPTHTPELGGRRSDLASHWRAFEFLEAPGSRNSRGPSRKARHKTQSYDCFPDKPMAWCSGNEGMTLKDHSWWFPLRAPLGSFPHSLLGTGFWWEICPSPPPPPWPHQTRNGLPAI